MKIGMFASLLLTCALGSLADAATITLSPPPAQNKTPAKVQAQPKVLPPAIKPSTQAKTDCPCNCPKNRTAHHKLAPRRLAQHPAPRNSHGRRYQYASATPFQWHQQSGLVTNGPAILGPAHDDEGLRIEDRGWSGGVGYVSEGGGGGGFIDGYGQLHFANGASVENGPTYNSYGQSFKYNPSQAGPFQPRLMGGFAPPSTGSR